MGEGGVDVEFGGCLDSDDVGGCGFDAKHLICPKGRERAIPRVSSDAYILCNSLFGPPFEAYPLSLDECQ